MLGQETGMELKEWKKKWQWRNIRRLTEVLYVHPEGYGALQVFLRSTNKF